MIAGIAVNGSLFHTKRARSGGQNRLLRTRRETFMPRKNTYWEGYRRGVQQEAQAAEDYQWGTFWDGYADGQRLRDADIEDILRKLDRKWQFFAGFLTCLCLLFLWLLLSGI